VKSFLVLITALALVSCSKNIDTPELVKQGIIKDIGKKVDVQNMDVNVDSVSFHDKEATASVSFRPKGGDPRMSMSMTYNMVRQGDEWHVKARDMMRHEQSTPQSTPPTGAGTLPPVTPGTPLPPGHPPMGSGTTGTMPMPIPRPVTSGTSGQLPSGHPPLNQ
jgi:hypothetical protein